MHRLLAELLDHLRLERLEVNLFRGSSRDIGSARVFGGQVLAQALRAAMHTVDERFVHSLHAYFLRAGDIDAPIIYDVDRARDGRSFSMRRVVAIQHGRQIFNLSASFQRSEDGLEHQAPMPEVAAPDGLAPFSELVKRMPEDGSARLRRFLSSEKPFDFRFVEQPEFLDPSPGPPERHVWFRAVDRLPDDDAVHRVLLAYVSDFNLVGTSIRPHTTGIRQRVLQMASLDHAMWFHRPARVDEWLLYALDSPNASGARGLARGRIYTADGVLVASTAQEGLIRLHDKPSGSDASPHSAGNS